MNRLNYQLLNKIIIKYISFISIKKYYTKEKINQNLIKKKWEIMNLIKTKHLITIN